MSNAHGNDGRGVRKFLRESGIKPTVANVEKMSKELRRSQSENERVDRIAKERGGPSTVDARGDVHERVRKIVENSYKNRR